MIGRPVAVVADAMAALHGLCGQSHAAAVHFAAAAATGTPLPRPEIGRWITRLAGERLAEHLRHLILGRDADGPSADDLAAFRAAIALGQAAARSGTVHPDATSLLLVMVGEGPPSTPVPASRPQGVDGGPSPTMTRSADVLSGADDAAIIAALAADTGFIRAPHLHGRVPETGPAARHGISAAEPEAAAAARAAEIREAAALLLDPGAASPDGWITADAIGPNAGYAAVETPRGRLYYRLVLDGDGNLRDARVLAPTEWNFHPSGPLVRALTGFRAAPDAVAAITRRAAAFDPCVALRVSVESAEDA
jgi:coenzyme F420-reducing hydrogenase alpha subunit